MKVYKVKKNKGLHEAWVTLATSMNYAISKMIEKAQCFSNDHMMTEEQLVRFKMDTLKLLKFLKEKTEELEIKIKKLDLKSREYIKQEEE